MDFRRIMLMMAIGTASAADPGVRAELSGTRCIYSSPHDESGRRIEVRVEVSPEEEGWHVHEAGSRGLVISGLDPAGNEYKSSPCAWEKTPGKEGSRTVCFVFPLKTKVERLVIREQIRVRLAHELLAIRGSKVNMLQPTRIPVTGSDEFIDCTPDAANAEPSNREKDGTLHAAGLTLLCPPGRSILRIGRVWEAEQGSDPDSSYTQDLEVRNSTDGQGHEVAHVLIWEAQEEESLEIEMCAGQSSVLVPLRVRAMLGDPAPPPQPK